MEDLLQSQIQESCRLALPNGLKELMSDISREVLRAQPLDLLNFISNYLASLLVTREHLSIAARVCNAVCDCACRPELDDELRYAGLDEENARDASDIIEQYFQKGKVNEGNLLLKLVRKTSIDEEKLPEILTAVRRAFLRHQRNLTEVNKPITKSGGDEISKAVIKTLQLYKKTDPSYEAYDRMARRIQAAYRAYKVRRMSTQSTDTDQEYETDELQETDTDKSKVTFGTEHITFGNIDQAKDSIGSTVEQDSNKDISLTKIQSGQSTKQCVNKLSSTSLAGSYLCLPKYKPYSAHDIETLVGLEEFPEKERSNIDYTRENSPAEQVIDDKDMNRKNKEKKYQNILLNEFSIEEEDSTVSYEFESSIEVIGEEGIPEENIVEENIVEENVTIEKDDGTAEVKEKEEIEEEIEKGKIEEETIVEEDITFDMYEGIYDIIEDMCEDIEYTVEEMYEGTEDKVEEDIMINAEETLKEDLVKEGTLDEIIFDKEVEGEIDQNVDVTGSY